jgi:FtsP/CotA-like multicopper oxidase with cupredoxin domain|tara:strand:- start:946 stop:2289 length:1344 start_codon:yes stop_codon:yes gene_type:complete
MPPLLDATASGAFELLARAGETNFLGQNASETWGFNDQSFLGPTLRLATDSLTKASVRNALDEPFSLHWHGLLVSGQTDGGPHQPIAPDDTWSVDLNIDQPPATAWYHSHTHLRTANHVQKGLAGVMQLTDGRDDERGLPSEYGTDDLTLVIQDRRFDRRGRAEYDPGMHDRMTGFTGDVILVNGQFGKRAVVPQGIVRLRLLNGSNARIYDLSSRAGREMHLVATDAGFLDRPIALNSLRLAPGERAEVLLDFTDGAGDLLIGSSSASGGMMGGMMGGAGSDSFDILPISVDLSQRGRLDRIPDTIGGTLPDLDIRNATRRDITLESGMGGMFRRGRNQHSINGQSFDMDRLNFSVQRGATEIWAIDGQTMAHPFHVHGVRFQVLSENGGPVSNRNRGWKDTVLVDGRAEIAMRFDQLASAATPFMFHCHILEHEDGGMMGQFSVV